MRNAYHAEILKSIQKHAGRATKHTFSDTYLGNNHPRYPISAPVLRKIAKDWMRNHRDLSPVEFAALLEGLIKAPSSTEKCMAGILLDASTKEQRQFDPKRFDNWLDHLDGWAEIDTVCTGKYTITEITGQWKSWKSLIIKFSKSKNINKRRASLVLFCSPLRSVKDERMAELALATVDRLKSEKSILITRAISWLLRSMEKLYREKLQLFLKENSATLPKVAVRETMTKLTTGLKGGARTNRKVGKLKRGPGTTQR
ncbi:MAG TPA: DNA alkylation repair protein [Chryseolinea sp.]|nr:DNA alkylation repair protein [Chryseolinea sp.]